jgi:hypothetical protein
MHYVVLMMLALAPHWVRVKDAYRIHERYVIRQHDGSQMMLGEFYEVAPGDIRAACYAEGPQGFSTDEAAMAYVLRCEVWR